MTGTLPATAALIAKYNRPGPRYTSYPTAVQFTESVGEDAFRNTLSSDDFAQGLSLYFHIPFCQRLCWYCGCNSVVERNPDRMHPYVALIKKEMAQVQSLLKGKPPVYQWHFGGGTPNQLPPAFMASIMEAAHNLFQVADDAEISIELDPRRMDDAYVHMLLAQGFNRFSMGIQDFDPQVQTAINRVQPFEMVADKIACLRRAGCENLNLDLIYGLPKQSPNQFATTVAAVIALQPERIALFNYAHVPWLKPHMKLIRTEDLPTPDQKFTMLTQTVTQLEAAGYVYIGMDHFAKADDPLAIALREGRLHRNFQGYTTRPDLAMLAFGNSAISMLDRLYVQNISDHHAYEKAVKNREALKWRGVALTDEDVMRRGIINHLMCYGEIDPSAIEVAYHIDFEDVFPHARECLNAMTEDGLLESMGRHYEITRTGQYLLRNVAMIFDGYLNQADTQQRFSKTI